MSIHGQLPDWPHPVATPAGSSRAGVAAQGQKLTEGKRRHSRDAGMTLMSDSCICC
ncbi:hypothetical protein [Chrysiogenes arsenatis]|uniref:hypothetical protein n=1 Tax=Chrysiogenes arsenatis TaxID=309797 RepID=UPI0004157B8A|nr:hypothetical protein [Chrysiogenes arsenatis]